ncbi:hypothetical protein A0J57_18185 [Sphingobium sp. 22B]|uniref:hypothetical protein n=1 Tax=unclassified Sphingobium TaxID=2611147 RepID=UPI000784DE53|nr:MULTISPECIES: hypothetical protein [unclassified Sphingobium]KXU29951.1 hypothetical protein AXW74_20445 [Sphingobium sp. AM]KYC30921.1 hypothetical protein A0J57_18185 [Sphingobium sp. 22B]OAP30453.1 hypothetical protein A8O16_18475 [Sphingobium sp. 20006FA]
MDLKSLARKLSAVDLADIEKEQAEVNERIAAIDAAVERGRAKSMQLTRQLADVKDRTHTGRSQADALLNGDDMANVVISEEKVRTEKEAIAAGMKALAADAEQLRYRRSELQQRARERLSLALESIVDEVRAEAEELAGRLARIYVDVQTLGYATKSAKATQLGTALDHGLNGLAAGRLIPRNYLIAAPELVAILEKNIPALKIAGTAIHARHRSSMM